MRLANLYPDADRPRSLMQEIRLIVSGLSFVSHIYLFGSLVRGEDDRWSDIDMLVVTQTYTQFVDVWRCLNDAKTILHHHPFTIADPAGGHALGNVFVGEAVFHCLDLNFLTLEEYRDPSMVERFGRLDEVYINADVSSTAGQVVPGDFQQALTKDEERISFSMHFTKKHLKKVLRGQAAHHDLERSAERLRLVMQDYSADYEVVGGRIGQIAQAYLMMADEVLANRLP